MIVEYLTDFEIWKALLCQKAMETTIRWTRVWTATKAEFLFGHVCGQISDSLLYSWIPSEMNDNRNRPRYLLYVRPCPHHTHRCKRRRTLSEFTAKVSDFFFISIKMTSPTRFRFYSDLKSLICALDNFMYNVWWICATKPVIRSNGNGINTR